MPELTVDYVISLLDAEYYLYYVDYRENLDEHLDLIQKAIKEKDYYPIDEEINEWYFDGADYSLDEIRKQLIEQLEEDFEPEEIEEFFEDYDNWDAIREVIYERDQSSILKDLLRNTQDPVCIFETGIHIYSSLYDSDLREQNLKEIKKYCKILLAEKKYDRLILCMIDQASYGGDLVIFFRGDIDQLINSGDKNWIEFSDPVIAIVDYVNGSGDDCTLNHLTFGKEYDTEKIFLEKTIKYSYTYECCGMSSNWCDSTDYKLSKKRIYSKNKKGNLTSKLQNQINLDNHYKEVYEKGGCSAGDIDMNRHRGVYYINDYPCGSHCPKCGQFWID